MKSQNQKNQAIHQPTLESIAMVEQTIKECSEKLGKFKLWKSLPRKMMYQTYSLIISYLENSGKLKIDEKKKLIWIQKPIEKIFKPQKFRKNMQKEKPVLTGQEEKIAESLNPNEIALLSYLDLGSLDKIVKESGLDEVSVLRALQFLENKEVIKLKTEKSKIIDLGSNGVIYQKNELPERRLLNLLAEKKELSLKEQKQIEKLTKLSENEFKAALGALKDKAMLTIKQDRLILNASLEEVAKKTLEEHLLNKLPLEENRLAPEQKLALENLKKRKNIIEIKEKRKISIELTNLGGKLVRADIKADSIESLTPEIIKQESWKGKKFRKYDIISKVPKIHGGKKHFVLQAAEYARKIWTELGFKEMQGNLIQPSFWNFDALFTAQDHPVRELQDTFYIKKSLSCGLLDDQKCRNKINISDIKEKKQTEKQGNLAEKEIIEAVKKAHEQGVAGSKGWQYKWNENEAKKLILRTHTTCLSALTLSKLRNMKNKQGKFFVIGKCFRNETLDWSHGFEFNQTEGIVIHPKANFTHLLGYLKEFFKKMGFEDIKFFPSYFPYTEPSVEIYAYNKAKKKWIEVGGAGILRPEVVIPLLGEYIPVLAWGPGFDRTIMDYYNIQDLREMYENDLTKLRNKKFWIK